MTTDPKPLNKVEVWVAEHAPPIFAAIALLIILGAIAVFVTYQEQGHTADTVTKVVQPQVTRISQAICDQASLESDKKARACAERIRIGLINCRRSTRCRAAYLALATYPPPAREVSSGSHRGGDALQQPSSHGHQQPGPGKGPHGGKHPAQSPTPTPSPPASQAPGASGEAPGQTGENPGQSGAEAPGQSGANHGHAANAEACVFEETCIGIEADLGP